MKNLFIFLFIFLCFSQSPIYRLKGVNETPEGIFADLILERGTNDDIKELFLQITYININTVKIKITDKNNKRWEVPEFHPLLKESVPLQKNYVVKVSDPFGITITRVQDQEVIFDSIRTPFIYKDHYISIGSSLPSREPNIYGLGERKDTFRLDPSNKTYVLWNIDAMLTHPKTNLYGSHPFYVEKRRNATHGFFYKNSNAMEFRIKPFEIQHVTIGGIIEIYAFVGPNPEETLRQYHHIIGKPRMIPYWNLGFHHTRWGYKDIHETRSVAEGYRKHEIPLESMWNDIEYMNDYKIFTFDPKHYPESEVKKFVEELHSHHQKYVLIMDPGVKIEKGYFAYENGMKDNLFIMKKDNSGPAVNIVWPGFCVFPDFSNPKVDKYWNDMIIDMYKRVPYDGLWLDMNEIATMCSGNCEPFDKSISSPKSISFDVNHPPYIPGGEPLYKRTLFMDTKLNISINYNVHNIYGLLQSISTKKALDKLYNKRYMILTRSSFSGSGHFTGHWTGDNESTFKDLYFSISQMLSFNLFGIPYVGADICGFFLNTTEELCIRWYQLGSFYPFSRNHNHLAARQQEPWTFTDLLINLSRKALLERYALIPYYYTLFYHVHVNGGSVMRSLTFEFQNDESLHNNDQQFMVGSALLVSPALQNRQRVVRAYFPNAIWYDYYNGRMITPGWKELEAPIEHIPVHIRGGYIIARHTPALTTYQARKLPYNLLIALDSNDNSLGDLYLDDGESLDSVSGKKHTLVQLRVDRNVLRNRLLENGYSVQEIFDKIIVYGVKRVCKVLVNGNEISTFRFENNVLLIHELSLKFDQSFVIEWKC